MLEIKINELRIGNYVGIAEFMNFKTVQVSEIRKERILVESKVGIFSSKNHKIIPIELTKKWFLNAGFEANKHGTLILKLELDRSLEIIETQEGFYCELVQLPELSSENLMFITLRKIDYVHELQNIYFTIKCEELVFSSTEP